MHEANLKADVKRFFLNFKNLFDDLEKELQINENKQKEQKKKVYFIF